MLAKASRNVTHSLNRPAICSRELEQGALTCKITKSQKPYLCNILILQSSNVPE